MASDPRSQDRPEHSGWAKGCGLIAGVTAGIMGLGTIALLALLLSGYSLDDLRSRPPDRAETIEQMREMVEVVDELYDNDQFYESGVEPTASFTPTPAPTPTRTPTPAVSEPEPEADPEPGDAVVPFEDTILGTSFRAPGYYDTGVTAVMGSPDAYTFAKTNACAMKLVVHAMPTAAFPGPAPLEALANAYQELQDECATSTSWAIVSEPSALMVNDQPAARMIVDRSHGEIVTRYMLTAIQGTSRSGYVIGQMGGGCRDNAAANAELTAMSDSVVLTDPSPVCYVGRKPATDPAEYGVGCDFEVYGFDGQKILADRDFTVIELGPVTWDEAAAFMRDHDQPRW